MNRLNEIIRDRHLTGGYGNTHLRMSQATLDLLRTPEDADRSRSPLDQLLAVPVVRDESVPFGAWVLADNATGEAVDAGVEDTLSPTVRNLVRVLAEVLRLPHLVRWLTASVDHPLGPSNHAAGFAIDVAAPLPWPVTAEGERGDILDLIDGAVEGVCACGCGAIITESSPSAWYASEACQDEFLGRRVANPDEVRDRGAPVADMLDAIAYSLSTLAARMVPASVATAAFGQAMRAALEAEQAAARERAVTGYRLRASAWPILPQSARDSLDGIRF